MLLVIIKKLINDWSYSFVCILKTFLLILTGHCMGEGCSTCLVCIYLSVLKAKADTEYFTVPKHYCVLAVLDIFKVEIFVKVLQVYSNLFIKFWCNNKKKYYHVIINLYVLETWSSSWLLSFLILMDWKWL